jgi:AbrB family looped-hinge helix DNA binding protein
MLKRRGASISPWTDFIGKISVSGMKRVRLRLHHRLLTIHDPEIDRTTIGSKIEDATPSVVVADLRGYAILAESIVLEAHVATKVTDQGQVTIPKWVQDQVGGPGSEVVFRRAADGCVIIEKAAVTMPLDPDRFAKLRGIADAGLSTDEIMAMTRGD